MNEPEKSPVPSSAPMSQLIPETIGRGIPVYGEAEQEKTRQNIADFNARAVSEAEEGELEG